MFSTMVGKEGLLSHGPLAGQLFLPDHHQLHLAGCGILLSIGEVLRAQEKGGVDVLWSLQMLQQGWTRVSGAVVWQGRPTLIMQWTFMGCTAYGGSLCCLLSFCSSPVLHLHGSMQRWYLCHGTKNGHEVWYGKLREISAWHSHQNKWLQSESRMETAMTNGSCEVFGSWCASSSLRGVLLLSPFGGTGYVAVMDTWIPAFLFAGNCCHPVVIQVATDGSPLHSVPAAADAACQCGSLVSTVSLPKCLERVAKLRGSESEICGGFSSQESSLWRQTVAQPVTCWVPCNLNS